MKRSNTREPSVDLPSQKRLRTRHEGGQQPRHGRLLVGTVILAGIWIMVLGAVRDGPRAEGTHDTTYRGQDYPAMVDDPEVIKNGRRTYMIHCSRCHGLDGFGAKATGGGGPNLTDDEWLHGSTYPEILLTVTSGVRGTLMPRWVGRISFERIQHVVAFVYGLRYRRLHDDPE